MKAAHRTQSLWRCQGQELLDGQTGFVCSALIRRRALHALWLGTLCTPGLLNHVQLPAAFSSMSAARPFHALSVRGCLPIKPHSMGPAKAGMARRSLAGDIPSGHPRPIPWPSKHVQREGPPARSCSSGLPTSMRTPQTITSNRMIQLTSGS